MATTPTDPATTEARAGAPAFVRMQGVLRKSARALGLVLLTFVVWVFVRAVADPDGRLSIDPGVIFAVGLVGAGVLLLRGQQPAPEAAEQTAPLPRARSPLGVLTLSAAFVVVGVLILVGNLGIAGVTVGQLAAAALTVVALGLVVGAWWGRSRLLVAVGVVLVPFVIVGGSMHFPLRGGLGDRFVHARSIDDVATNHEILLGGIHMDLARLRDFTGEREIHISMAAGQATIFVPDRIGLTVTGEIEWGNAAVGQGPQRGDDLVLDSTIPGPPGSGHLTIDFSGGIASLYVERISHADLHGPLPQEPRRNEEQRGRRGERERKTDRRTDRGGRDRAKT
ncbi:MAG TPA: hypothetical protein VHN37_15500 [Actinomycetota bacterium]|nr:hypothetical protein [Actinomycetota bacterium]